MSATKQNDATQKSDTSEAKEKDAFAAPSISLPKGGGAIRGIGEKFAANPVTGTGSMSVPIATSPGRSGFGPQLSLSYDSGAGNGPFGLGWNLSLPSLTRKTDKGLPQYRDAEESDVFILSGAEDLVPVFKGKNLFDERKCDKDGNLVEGTEESYVYLVRKYRPRIEGLFARIERWVHKETGDVHWRSISKDNILTIYGKDKKSRIYDPNDDNKPNDKSHIFSWLICETRDDKGNAIIYEYKAEDNDDIDFSKTHEKNRGDDKGAERTANRYIKRIYYGNKNSLLNAEGKRPNFLNLDMDAIKKSDWMFEVVFDYGEHDLENPKPENDRKWPPRQDPFSSYRAGFEIRTYRLCQRVLMFHRFPEEEVGDNCLVRSTDFNYSNEVNKNDVKNSVYTFLCSVTQTGYRRSGDAYIKRSLPEVEFEYSKPVVQDTVEKVDATSLENLPYGIDGNNYKWLDLHGEGLPGILSEQAGAWFYKRNLSPINEKKEVDFAPTERVAIRPNLSLSSGVAQFMDLAADGQPDLVVLDGPMPGFYEHDDNEGWQSFKAFASKLNCDMNDPNLKFIDLNGDGLADILISEDNVFVWHASLGEEGFGPAQRVSQAWDDEKGPRIVFADSTESIHMADFSGDGLTDIVRIKNGEVCYWPNLGYGKFGAKVTMDNPPTFDNFDQFDPKRIRLADIDGSGTTDIIYLHGDGVRLYFNQSGNSWSVPTILPAFARIDNLISIMPLDLLGNGTACLVWSSPLPGDSQRQMCFVNLMGAQKPHLLIKTINNLGAETTVKYVSSTKFYLKDKREGNPWITKLPFPVHVVERIEIYDCISRNAFITRYAYHHGYFDGVEREFRGFGMVEQWDTQAFETFNDTPKPLPSNIDESSYVPPVYTKTWFHTGVYVGRDNISNFFAGASSKKNPSEYYRESAWKDNDIEAKKHLLDDTVLPVGILQPKGEQVVHIFTFEEEREACRCLKGAMLRQEIYAEDGTEKAEHPYMVTEQNFTIECLQPQFTNKHSVFFAHPREAISYHYERNLADPRVMHSLTLGVDIYGNVLRSASIAYSRRIENMSATELKLKPEQTKLHITSAENSFTNEINSNDAWRTPLPSEARSFELTWYLLPKDSVGFELTELLPSKENLRFSWNEVRDALDKAIDFAYETKADEIKSKLQEELQNKLASESAPESASKPEQKIYAKRLIEHVLTLYRSDDLTKPLDLHVLESLALAYQSYKLAFTPGLLEKVFAGKVDEEMLQNKGHYVHSGGDVNWWIPSGLIFYSANSSDFATQELDFAKDNFFLPRRYRTPFHTQDLSTETIVTYDKYNLLLQEVRDSLNNRVSVGERELNPPVNQPSTLKLNGNDYRVLQPCLMMDANRNQTKVVFDALGFVVGTAVMGKPKDEDNPKQGDIIDDSFNPDLSETEISAHLQNPLNDPPNSLSDPHSILKQATSRLIYDFFAYKNSKDKDSPQPAVVYTLVRETHVANLAANQQTIIQHQFSYSDGFGREIQKKIQAESGPVPKRDNTGHIITNNGQPEMTAEDFKHRWVGSGWTIFNNKGKPVRQYEPFFTNRHTFEFEPLIGVSPVIFYDPLERVIATLHPNHTWEKVSFDPWQQKTWDVNDTLGLDPHVDDEIQGYVKAYFALHPEWKTWRQQRIPDLGNLPKDTGGQNSEQDAALRSLAHADTPSCTFFDSLGRNFLSIADNGKDANEVKVQYLTRVVFDIEGNELEVIDAKGKAVMRYDYDMLGNRIHQASMEAGESWSLNDVSGKPLYSWDSRGHRFYTEYDQLRRPLKQFVMGTNSTDNSAKSDPRIINEGFLNQELLIDVFEYGEGEGADDNIKFNLRTHIVQHKDAAGIVTNGAYDFKGNLLKSSRQIAKDYKKILDWRTSVDLEETIYNASTVYDALNRPFSLTSPDSSTVIPHYNEANLLDKLDVNLRAEKDNNGHLVWTSFVTNIDYNARGQRTLIQYGNGAETHYHYDVNTFRLIQLYTRRGPAFTEDCGNDPPPPRTAAPIEPSENKPCGLQNLFYTYDPAGNITNIRDAAQQRIYFKNQIIDANNDYHYDAIYRLISATGREHLGQNSPIPHSYNDALRINQAQPNDVNAMGRYTETYQYDEVGNFIEMKHLIGDGNTSSSPSWSRFYEYTEASLLESHNQSNRLSRTTLNRTATQPTVEKYVYDVHGNMLSMPQLQVMEWDFNNRLIVTQRQVVNTEDTEGDKCRGERTYYVYDSTGQRVRKVTELAVSTENTPLIKDERIYLGGFEIYRKHSGNAITRETLHIMDDKQRIAMVEMRTAGNEEGVPARLIRYQFGNHLGSASLELDEKADIISYEEYTPYGSTDLDPLN